MIIVHYHLFLSKLWNGLGKIFHFFMLAAHVWTGKHCDYHLDAAAKKLKRMQSE